MHYIDKGEGPETIVFSHGLLFSSEMFADQIAHFKDHYRCVAFDHRGQGQSPVTKDGYDLDTLADDAIKLIEVLEIGPCHFAGLSMGGMVGMRVAVKRPDLLKSLILIDTSADGEPEGNKSGYAMLNFIGRWFGFRVVVNKIMPIMFGKTFLNEPARATDRQKWSRFLVKNRRVGTTRAVKGVIGRSKDIEGLDQIGMPTLILVGDEDVATPPENSRKLQGQISGSKLVIIPRSGHSSTIEEPAAVNAEINEFFAKL